MFEEYFDTTFDRQELTGFVNEFPIMFGLVRERGIFSTRSVPTTQVRIDVSKNRMTLLPIGERGADGVPVRKRSDDAHYLTIPHIPHKGSVTPEDVQDRRRPGVDELESIEDALVEELQSLRRNHDITQEMMLVSALKGQLIDGDGDVLYDYFDEFAKTKRVFNLELDNANTNILKKCRELKQLTRNAMVGDTMTGLWVPSSPSLIAMILEHPSFEKYQVNQPGSATFIEDEHTIIKIGGVIFEEYDAAAPRANGQVVDFIADGYGHATPLGTMNTFVQINGPAYAMSQANSAPSEGGEGGEDGGIYVTTDLLKHDAGVDMKAQANRLMLCQQPGVLTEVVAA
ncbi:MAG: major capsid protein [Parvibaculaceae bacterium]|nr:major capsid protein [Parvibaculaceae bacterium]